MELLVADREREIVLANSVHAWRIRVIGLNKFIGLSFMSIAGFAEGAFIVEAQRNIRHRLTYFSVL